MSVVLFKTFSQLSVVPLNSSVKEWNITSNETEDITLIACSNNLVCFATSNYLLRIFTAYGVQKSVLRIPGPAITMAAKEHYLLVAYHSAAPRKEDFCVNVMLLNLEGKNYYYLKNLYEWQTKKG